jgi:hypothetical protein
MTTASTVCDKSSLRIRITRGVSSGWCHLIAASTLYLMIHHHCDEIFLRHIDTEDTGAILYFLAEIDYIPGGQRDGSV